jgi:predicted XRE-type DNA-binding protein
MSKEISFTKSNGNIFKDAGYSEEEAKGLQFRSYLMTALKKYISSRGWSQKEAAEKLNVTQPRISNLICGRIDLFSAGVLIEMLERAGFKIYEKIERNIDNEFKTKHWAHPLKELGCRRTHNL